MVINSWNRGTPRKPERLYREALKLNEELGNKEGMAIAYGNFGILYVD